MNAERARRLRRYSTDAERKLWRYLRNRQLAGMKFRRQHPLGPFIVDFCCEEGRLGCSWMGASMDGSHPMVSEPGI